MNHRFEGIVQTLPPDKSISHRAALIGAIANGETQIENFSTGNDNAATLSALAQLGVSIFRPHAKPNAVVIRSKGLFSLTASLTPIQCNNSGSTMRMLAGILAAQPFSSTLIGDDSLMKRPMKRIAAPLSAMGATISLSDADTAPISLIGRKTLKPIQFRSPVASAQVKSAVIFAALHAEGESEIVEPIPTRNHTELMLGLTRTPDEASRPESNSPIVIRGLKEIEPKSFFIPADPSAACFLVALGLLSKSKELVLKDVCLNPTRIGFLDVLKRGGANISTENLRRIGGETIGDLALCNATLAKPLRIFDKSITANVIDELPMLAVLSALSTHEFEVRNAAELRHKECDRISALVQNLQAMGFMCDEFEDGFAIRSRDRLPNGVVPIHTFHDHRIAMSFAVANYFSDAELVLDDAACAAVSFPNFFELISDLQVK